MTKEESSAIGNLTVHIEYIRNHLRNIDSHMDRLNGSVREAMEKAIVCEGGVLSNKSHINRLYCLGGGIFGVLVAILALLVVAL